MVQISTEKLEEINNSVLLLKKGIEPENKNSLLISVDENPVTTSAEDGCNNFNIMIANVSKCTRIKETKYKDEKGNDYNGIVTNEAPIKSVIYRLQEKGEFLHKIYFIASEGVSNDLIEGEGKTTKEFLKEKITSYCMDKNYHEPVFEYLNIKNEPLAEDVSKVIFELYNNLKKELNNPKNKCNVYIESNGGIRYVLTMLLSITKTMENCYPNLKIIETTAMVYGEDPVTIKNVKHIYDTAQITGVVGEFINYGRIAGLLNYIDNMIEVEIVSEKERTDIKNVLGKLTKLSDDIQLCRTNMMLEDFYKDGGIGKAIEDYKIAYKDSTISIITIFIFILEMIQQEVINKMYLSTPVYKF